MKAALQLKMNQQLTMTPQLQQAIHLLQLSSLELQQEIQQAVESNPLLEAEDNAPDKYPDTDQPEMSSNHTSKESESTWEWQSSTAYSGFQPDDHFVPHHQQQTLQDYLQWQLNLTPFSDIERSIGLYIIDSIDDDGYLGIDYEEIYQHFQSSKDTINQVIKRVQRFDPVGVGSRTLQECLLIQLEQYSLNTPWLNEAKTLLKHHMALLATKDFRLLLRQTKLKEHELKKIMTLIQKMHPKPGRTLIQQAQDYIIPDAYMFKKNNQWYVDLNSHSVPKININQQYASLMNTSLNKADSQFIKGHLQEAKWFIKSVENRNDTLLKVAQCIVNFQHNFFEHGDEAMKPMVLNDIATTLNMHESTISRVTNQKYIHTPKGIFELKYFFSSHVATASGGECSSTAIRALIKKLIAAENPQKPLSDNKIAKLLESQGINIARRTIAKYRESMLIQPSNQRKSL
ncbi:MAG: RNA polymerase factor sigma-54 [Shewanellaceae bacterium]|nr:RNA polymerase factor sigma-54 [Shewanellaceae bacterium]